LGFFCSATGYPAYRQAGGNRLPEEGGHEYDKTKDKSKKTKVFLVKLSDLVSWWQKYSHAETCLPTGGCSHAVGKLRRQAPGTRRQARGGSKSTGHRAHSERSCRSARCRMQIFQKFSADTYRDVRAVRLQSQLITDLIDAQIIRILVSFCCLCKKCKCKTYK
jgi:hypothetical protein